MLMSMPSDDEAPAYFEFDQDLCCAGQPSPAQIEAFAMKGIDCVVNLATAASSGHLPHEPALWDAHGVEFDWQPVDWQQPTMQDYRRFEQWLLPRRGRHCLVHCAKNFRASLFCFVFLCVNENANPKELWPKVLAVWEPDAVWSGLAKSLLSSRGVAADWL